MKGYAVKPGSKVSFKDFDPGDTSLFPDKDKADSKLKEIKKRIFDLQEILYASKQKKIIIVLQGMDTAGKDGTIRHVFEGINPQGVQVASFKKPSEEELDHDYLWRVHVRCPRAGQIVIFNRSHYEDVLVVRIHSLVPEDVWSKRYRHINEFERMLTDEGTIILKFFLHIDRDEQRKRLQKRIDDPSKHWKLSASDIPERKLWDKYMKANQEMIEKTSTDYAPWHVIPANKKWHRNLVISSCLLDALQGIPMKLPQSTVDVSTIKLD